jgi:hypothetical protein
MCAACLHGNRGVCQDAAARSPRGAPLATATPALGQSPTRSCVCAQTQQLYIVTRALEFFQPELARLSLGGILADIRTSMMDEVDFRKVCATACVVCLCVAVCCGCVLWLCVVAVSRGCALKSRAHG